MDQHEPRCLVAHLPWPAVVTLRVPGGSARISYIPTPSPPTREKSPKKSDKHSDIGASLLYALLLVGCGKVDPTLPCINLKNVPPTNALEPEVLRANR